MSFTLVPGNALGCNLNSHRDGWNGNICDTAASWNCGAPQYFREDYCERKDPRCFHLHVFDEQDPHLVIPENGAGWILEEDPHALDDQIFILWGAQFSEPRGIREGHGPVYHVFGAYRIKTVELLPFGPHTHYKVVPHSDGWTEFAQLRIPRPYYQTAGGPYIKQIDRRAVERVFNEAKEASTQDHLWTGANGKPKERLKGFVSSLDGWFETALQKSVDRSQATPARVIYTSEPTGHKPFKDLHKLVKPKTPPPPTQVQVQSHVPVTKPRRHTVTEVVAERPALGRTTDPAFLGPVLETAKEDDVLDRYGEDTLRAIQVGSMTKPLLILRGEPGVGKSTLALNLLDDAPRDRTCVVPVASTWRGRDDLFGYINPVNNQFEATRFTRFLYEAEKKWTEGDRQLQLVVFEEFNISQPEYWLSDILVLSQYPADPRSDRTVKLGGEAVRGLDGVDPSGVFLSPAVRFVATINNDLTTRPLSPRVLDRAAVVELTMEPPEAVRQTGLQLTEDQLEAISDLSFRLKSKGATFSFRTAQSLKVCVDRMEELKLGIWDAIDLVLLQEVLAKVRLLAGDPGDQRLIGDLVKWSEGNGVKLRRCSSSIAQWREMLSEGQDVVQA